MIDWVELLILAFTAGTFALVLVDLLGGFRGVRRRWQKLIGLRATFSVAVEGNPVASTWLPGYYGTFSVRVKAVSPAALFLRKIIITVPVDVIGPSLSSGAAGAWSGSEVLMISPPTIVGDGSSGQHYFAVVPPGDFQRSRECVCTFRLWAPATLRSYRVTFGFSSDPPTDAKQDWQLDFPPDQRSSRGDPLQ